VSPKPNSQSGHGFHTPLFRPPSSCRQGYHLVDLAASKETQLRYGFSKKSVNNDQCSLGWFEGSCHLSHRRRCILPTGLLPTARLEARIPVRTASLGGPHPCGHPHHAHPCAWRGTPVGATPSRYKSHQGHPPKTGLLPDSEGLPTPERRHTKPTSRAEEIILPSRTRFAGV